MKIVVTFLLLLMGTMGNAQNTANGQIAPNKMWVGAAYYPNDLSVAQIQKDAQLMQQAGFTVARMGDLVWASVEPKEGVYDFSWLHLAVDVLGKAGIKTFLATPTAAIPKWMYDKHPDIMQVTASGERKPYGKRRHACLNNPQFRQYCTNLVTAMAKEFKNDTNIIAYQVDNELMAEEPYCYCNYCQKQFAQWLAAKYGTIDSVNKAWNLSFWSENLPSFNNVFLPRKGDNPSAFLNYQQFCSDYTIDFYNLQRNSIKAFCPGVPVSHNICSSGFLYQLDLYKIAQTCDFMSIDNYPYAWTLENEYGYRGPFTYTPHMASLALAQLHGAKPQVPFWITEAQIGRTAGNQRKLVEPGTVRLWSVQEMAQGATGISFFSFKTFPAAHEHVMVGVLDDDGLPRRRFFEAQQVAKELAALKATIGTTMPISKAAIIRDFKQDWAFEDGRFAFDFRYMREVFKYYSCLRNAAVTTDVISSADSFDKYRLIVVPSMVLINKAVSQKLQKAAENGATIVITCMTGLRNDNLASCGSILDASIEALAGIKMEEQHALISAEQTQLTLINDTTTYQCGLWHDVFSATTATPIGFYNSRFFKGKPVITKNKYGKGTVYYVGSVVNEGAASNIIAQSINTAAIKPLTVAANELVELTEVASSKGKFLFAINYANQDQTIQLTTKLTDVVTHEIVSNAAVIKARDFRVFQLGQ